MILHAISTVVNCVNTCTGVEVGGRYHSCRGCHSFATCGAGGVLSDQDCAANLTFDATVKTCTRTSTTCIVPRGEHFELKV